MNADVRVLLADAERALRADKLAAARAAFLEAGQSAASYQLWRSALRCYRRALELDLADREAVGRIGQWLRWNVGWRFFRWRRDSTAGDGSS